MKIKFAKITLYVNSFLFASMVAFSFTGSTRLFTLFGKSFSMSFYISLIAIPFFYISYFFFYRNKFLNKTIIDLILCFCFIFIASLAMGFVLYPSYNGLFGTTPLKVVIENAVKYAYDLLLIPFFAFYFSFINRSILRRSIIIFLFIWILFGFFQIVAFTINSNVLWNIYDSIDFLKILGGSSETFQRIRLNYGSFRFYGISSEPASNCVLISVILIPFHIIELQRKNTKIFYKISLLFSLSITLFFAYLTKSASVYVGLLIIIIYFIYYLFFKAQLHIKYKIMLIFLFSIFAILIFLIPKSRDIILNKFILKLFNKNDYSTQHRYSTIWNDILVFIKNPLFGVGDGNQGFFYSNNIIGTWMSNNAETQMAIKGELGLLNGGAGIPSIISGFGIYGIFIISKNLKEYYRHWSKRNKSFAKHKLLYRLCGVTFIVLLIGTQGIHRNYLLFMYLTANCFGTFKIKNFANILSVLQTKDSFCDFEKLITKENYASIKI